MTLTDIERMHQQYARPAITIDVTAEGPAGLWSVPDGTRQADQERPPRGRLEQSVRVAAILAVGAGIALLGGRLVAMATKPTAASVAAAAPATSQSASAVETPAAALATSEQWPAARSEPAASQPAAVSVDTAHASPSSLAGSEVGAGGKPSAMTPTKGKAPAPSSPAKPTSPPEKVGTHPADIRLF